ncbi:sec1 family domain-containing protein MIP3 isoform X1 [Macadamia integrifolia]|uniref:sec1 family domain-containing protein MIP3 isoform X1 n=2 Tax=Macadamia integrifolia TaxID=60698 RepID=UPI001C4FCB12|nr:sec1 family domain-containing protein MIP3 isoform X1 [Macadamia integrifolia]
MALVDVIRLCLDSIRQMSDHIEDAILYLDAGCTEAFQCLGAFPLFLELGARAVCSLENMSAFDTVVDWNSHFDSAKKMVVITSRLLSDAHRYILRCLSTHKTILHCAIFTSISEMGHSAYADSPLGPEAFREYESLLLQDYEEHVRMYETREHSSPEDGEWKQSEEGSIKERGVSEDEGWSQLVSSEEAIPHPEASFSGRDLEETSSRSCNDDLWKKLDVCVRHFPMVMCPLSPRVFALPSEGTVAEACLSTEHEDSLSPGLPPISTGLPPDGDETPPGATLTAEFLYHLAAKMDLKMEIFSLGDLSKTIGKIMTNMSSLYDVGRRKRSAGLLLVDRTLDLITPCCHGDSLFDRIFSSLPRKERTTSSAHGKGSQIQNKHVPASLQRGRLDVQIPLAKILGKEESATYGSELPANVEAFLCGWNSSNSASPTGDLNNPSSKICSEKCVRSEIGLLNGSFVSTENYQGVHYLESILDKRTKEGTLLIKKWLQEDLRRQKLIVDTRTRPGLTKTSELHTMVKALAENQSSLMKNRGIIQLTAAAELALSEPHASHWDAFISAERILSVSAGDTSQSLSAQICDLINKSVLVRSQNMESSQGLLSFQDALLLAIIGYILAGENFPTSGSDGPFSWQEEHLLKESIVDAILENPAAAKLKFLHGIAEELECNVNKIKPEKPKEPTIDDFDDDQWGNWGDEDTDHNNEQVYDDMQLKLELRDRVDNLFKLFHKLSSLKNRQSMLREGPLGLESNYGGDPYMSKGLLYRLLTMILSKFDIPGLHYHSSTVGRIFKSGFGRFGLGQAKPNLGDQSVILIFVVGGINGVEVREAQEAFSESGRPNIELIIGGTTILTPENMLDLLLGSSSYT